MARKTIGAISATVDYAVLAVIVLLLCFAAYALWDSEQLYAAASGTNYTVYKPAEQNEGMSFVQLQAINPEVFSWLTVYGTNIDYPVVQSTSNMKYVNTSAEGSYSLSGAIFLDSDSSKDFSDFNSILYGHHMEKKAMFGEIGDFLNKEVFESHRYGNLFFDGKNHGIEFFAFLHVDAYDSKVFSFNVQNVERQAYLDNLLANGIHTRDIGATTADRIVLLTTCSPRTTNGRDILVGRISDEVFENPFPDTQARVGGGHFTVASPDSVWKLIPPWAWSFACMIALVLLVLLVLLVPLLFMMQRRNEKQKLRLGGKQ